MIVACENCGTHHRAVTRAQAELHLQMRQQSWDGFGDPPDLADYQHCRFCGSDSSCLVAAHGTDAAHAPIIIWERNTMRAEELHPHGTYAELVPDAATRDLLADLAARLGITNATPPDQFHTTVIYSKRPCPSIQDMDGSPFTHPARITGLKTWDTQQGTRCLVALVSCPQLEDLHHRLRDQHGATHDYPDFQPHFTLSYDCGDGELALPPGDHRVRYEGLRVKPLDPKWSA